MWLGNGQKSTVEQLTHARWTWITWRPAEPTSDIIIWQSNVPLPPAALGRSTCDLILVTTGAPKVILGTKCPSICVIRSTRLVSGQCLLGRWTPNASLSRRGHLRSCGIGTTKERNVQCQRVASPHPLRWSLSMPHPEQRNPRSGSKAQWLLEETLLRDTPEAWRRAGMADGRRTMG